jgi:S1-C subfamily serine protease
MAREMYVRRGLAIFAGLVALAIGGLIGSLATAKAISGRAVPIFVTSAQGPVQADVSIETGFAPVVRLVAPSVVNISSTRVVRNPAGNTSPLCALRRTRSLTSAPGCIRLTCSRNEFTS